MKGPHIVSYRRPTPGGDLSRGRSVESVRTTSDTSPSGGVVRSGRRRRVVDINPGDHVVASGGIVAKTGFTANSRLGGPAALTVADGAKVQHQAFRMNIVPLRKHIAKLLRQGRPDTALPYAEIYAAREESAGETHPRARTYLAKIHLELGNFDEAIESARIAERLQLATGEGAQKQVAIQGRAF